MVAVREWRTAPPAELSSDAERTSFSWPGAAGGAALAESLGRWGVLRPLLAVAEADGRLRVAAGARRLEWARAAGAAQVPVAVLAPCTPAGLWERLLADAADHRPLNPVEVGLYLRRRTAHTGESLEELAAAVFPRLGLAPRGSAAGDHLWVSALPPEHRDGFADGSRPLHAARLLAGASREDALAVLAATAGLAGGVNKFTELVRDLLECAWRDGAPVALWLEREGLAGPWPNLDALRREVRRRRHPRLADWEARFPAAVAGAGLPSGVSIQPPRGFEGGRCQCRAEFTSLEGLGAALDAVREGLAAGRLEALREFLD